MGVFEKCPNEYCADGTLLHYGKFDVVRLGKCPDCNGTGKVMIEDKEKEAMLQLIMEIASTPYIGKTDGKLIRKAQEFLKKLPKEYLR